MKSEPRAPHSDPRAAALAALNAVLGDEGMMLAELPEEGASPADRARARRLSEGVLRQIGPIDQILGRQLRKSPPLILRNILRLGLYELGQGEAAHGVVNSYVTLARKNKKTQHGSGLVNAVLRALSAPEALEALATAPVQKLPRWLRQPMVHHYGREAVATMETVFASQPPLDLSRLGAGVIAPEGIEMPTGSLRLMEPGQVSALAGYAQGGWWVQDAAAAMAAKLLDAQKGERVLDLCAAPGGKTMQLAAAGADVTAIDISAPRLKRMGENLARTGLKAEVIATDALSYTPAAPFDAILLDAPCSTTGTIRRHPDLPFVKDGSEIEGLAALQTALVERALGWLKPGGRLVFATCSLLREEGEDQLNALIARHPELKVDRPSLAGVDEAWWTPEGGLRLRPDYWAEQGGMDGFYLFRVTKA